MEANGSASEALVWVQFYQNKYRNFRSEYIQKRTSLCPTLYCLRIISMLSNSLHATAIVIRNLWITTVACESRLVISIVIAIFDSKPDSLPDLMAHSLHKHHTPSFFPRATHSDMFATRAANLWFKSECLSCVRPQIRIHGKQSLTEWGSPDELGSRRDNLT